jgi:CBS domain-containing protein
VLASTYGRGDCNALPKTAHKPFRLPIVTCALDFEELTQPVQTVLCPARHDRITVGNCRQCRDFRRIEQSAAHGPVVCCGAGDSARQSSSKLSVQQAAQLPSLSVRASTPLSTLLSYADGLRAWEGVPVLDMAARPIGILMSSELTRLRAARPDPTLVVGMIMSTSFTTVFPCMSLVDAAQLRAAHLFRGVIVVSEMEQFLGVVWEPDLERACASVLESSALPP